MSVQEVLEMALSTILRQTIEVVGAGRTDAGVHARQMFAHFDAVSIGDKGDLAHRLNALLPEDIAIQKIHSMVPGAHARFDALERAYQYLLIRQKDPFYNDYAHRLDRELDLKAMNQAAQFLLQYKNFECFSKSNSDVKTFDCELRHAHWEVEGDLWVFSIKGDRFLRNMVRAIVGTLLEVGMGKRTPGDIHELLASGDRGRAGVSVPAKGLYLTEVSYPKELFDEQK
jgi:tRNA pseudouridine38-40 synthase